MTRTRVRHVATAACLAGVLVLACSCTSGSSSKVEAAVAATPSAGAVALSAEPTPTTAPAAPSTPATAPVVGRRKRVSRADISLEIDSPASSAVRLDAPVTVSVTGGRLTSVAVGVGKNRLAGSLDVSATRWTSSAALRPWSTYTVKASAVDAAGVKTSRTVQFRTVKPAGVLKTKIAPLDGETVGVGMPVIVYFTKKVTDKAAVERRLRVTSSSGAVGSWHWLSRTEVHYRPRVYWPKGETVRVDVRLSGVDAGKGIWGTDDRSIFFRVGRSHISVVDAKTHTMTVKEDGKVVRRFAVSTGRDEFPTSSGVHVVMSKDPVYWMDSATIGIPRKAPGGYYKKVLSSVRISNSGEFVHAAPWSARDQGRRNVSHGCVNASVVDAAWFLRFSRRGDIVDIVGTPRKLQLGNGFADWTVPWKDWVKGSALAV